VTERRARDLELLDALDAHQGVAFEGLCGASFEKVVILFKAIRARGGPRRVRRNLYVTTKRRLVGRNSFPSELPARLSLES